MPPFRPPRGAVIAAAAIRYSWTAMRSPGSVQVGPPWGQRWNRTVAYSPATSKQSTGRATAFIFACGPSTMRTEIIVVDARLFAIEHARPVNTSAWFTLY